MKNKLPNLFFLVLSFQKFNKFIQFFSIFFSEFVIKKKLLKIIPNFCGFKSLMNLSKKFPFFLNL
jgi:hypothetical protein